MNITNSTRLFSLALGTLLAFAAPAFAEHHESCGGKHCKCAECKCGKDAKCSACNEEGSKKCDCASHACGSCGEKGHSCAESAAGAEAKIDKK